MSCFGSLRNLEHINRSMHPFTLKHVGFFSQRTLILRIAGSGFANPEVYQVSYRYPSRSCNFCLYFSTTRPAILHPYKIPLLSIKSQPTNLLKALLKRTQRPLTSRLGAQSDHHKTNSAVSPPSHGLRRDQPPATSTTRP